MFVKSDSIVDLCIAYSLFYVLIVCTLTLLLILFYADSDRCLLFMYKTFGTTLSVRIITDEANDIGYSPVFDHYGFEFYWKFGEVHIPATDKPFLVRSS